MLRARLTLGVMLTACIGMAAFADAASPLQGTYVEARTCQVYTGPCFANGEVGSTGKDAIMTWKIVAGEFSGVDLSETSVALVMKTSHTLGFNGFDDAATKRAVVIVDEKANDAQAAALRDFAMLQAGLAEEEIAAERRAAIGMEFDFEKLTAAVDIEEVASLHTRKARKGDCICSNESAYYPPLTELEGFVPGVTIEGDVVARELGARWSIPDSRTAYMGTFRVKASDLKLASKL